MQEHASRKHALLSASGASRWINCPPSARLTEGMADKWSAYADEGTAAHEYAEIKLTRRLTKCNSADRERLDRQAEALKTNQYYNAEMEAYVQSYVDLVEERFLEARSLSGDAMVLLEAKLDLTEWIPDGFGTSDVTIISDGVLEVIDLKYGKGVPVSAINNSQLRLYALGALAEFVWMYDIHTVRMTIIQPRLDSVSTDEISVEELNEWAESVVKPAASLAHAGEGEYKAGDHCRWCLAKGNCRARADENLKAIAYEFQEPALLSNEEIGPILHIAEQLQSWVKDVQEYALEQALHGEKIPQWKLVEGKSKRVITDTQKAATLLTESGYSEDKLYKPRELRAMTALEKTVGKKNFAEILGDLITKQAGKPTLVAETDSRPELNSAEADFK